MMEHELLALGTRLLAACSWGFAVTLHQSPLDSLDMLLLIMFLKHI